MPDLLLDHNIPYPVLAWLRSRLPDSATEHCSDLELGRCTDSEVFQSAQAAGAIIITYDEDFADLSGGFAQRSHSPARAPHD